MSLTDRTVFAITIASLVLFPIRTSAQTGIAVGATFCLPLPTTENPVTGGTSGMLSYSPRMGIDAALEYRGSEWVPDSTIQLHFTGMIGYQSIVTGVRESGADSCRGAYSIMREYLQAGFLVGGEYTLTPGLRFQVMGGPQCAFLLDNTRTGEECDSMVTTYINSGPGLLMGIRVRPALVLRAGFFNLEAHVGIGAHLPMGPARLSYPFPNATPPPLFDNFMLVVTPGVAFTVMF